jgi:hypothetical protein
MARVVVVEEQNILVIEIALNIGEHPFLQKLGINLFCEGFMNKKFT